MCPYCHDFQKNTSPPRVLILERSVSPSPLIRRPRLGTRLYVRGNTRRILRALLEELCNWICKTRLQSAMLLRTIIIFCEVHTH